MKIEFTGRQTEVPEELRLLAARKLDKLGKVLRGITRVHVVLAVDRHRQIAEVSAHSKRLTVTAQERGTDFGASLAAAFDKLTRQVQRHIGRIRQRKRGGAARTAARRTRVGSDGATAPGEPSPRVIKTRRFPVKPMTVDEAVLEVGDRAEGFLVFRDASTERVSVLYRRKDGNLGLIEPEA
jgi:putative sigma-54 modulation protein